MMHVTTSSTTLNACHIGWEVTDDAIASFAGACGATIVVHALIHCCVLALTIQLRFAFLRHTRIRRRHDHHTLPR